MNFFDADSLTGEDRAEVDLFVSETDAPATGDHDGPVVKRIIDIGQSFIEARRGQTNEMEPPVSPGISRASSGKEVRKYSI